MKGKKYYKCHNSYSHAIQKAIKDGRFKLVDKGIVEMTMDQDMVSLEITIRNYKELKITEMIKPPSIVPQDKWMIYKVFKEPTPKTTL